MPTALNRRWFQFSLGTFLLLIALVAVALFAAKEHTERKRLERELAIQQDTLLHKLQKELDGVDMALSDLSRQIRSKDSPAMRRITRHRDIVKAKIEERRSKLLNDPTSTQ